MRTLHIIGLVGALAASATGAATLRAAFAEPVPAASAFDREMAISMARMHADMDLPPSGDPDRDFATMMIPHHLGAIDMARAELAYGRDPVLRRLAQGIIVEQAQEIAVMRGALADLPQRPAASSQPPAAPSTGHHHHQGPMESNKP